MQPTRLRRYREFTGRLDGLLSASPIITYGLALPFAVMGTVDTRSALGLSLAMFCINAVAVLLAYFLKKAGLGREVYMLITALVSTLTLVGISGFIGGIHNRVFSLMGIYFPLLSVNTLTFFLVTRCDPKKSLLNNLLRSVRTSLSFLIVVMPIAAFRELFGKGSLYGVQLFSGFQIPSVLLPFFGFILVGMVCALTRFVSRNIKYELLLRDRRDREAAREEGEKI
ncbi:MAG: hypothetical protein KH009_04715 [Clostridiales bacterium]|nr:hypothetical protein [Clostridiales bacterium]